MTNIVRSEPDPSLFEVPSGYKVLSEPAVAYTISTSNGQAKGQGLNVVWTTKSSGSGSAAAPAVTSTKP